MFLEFKRNLYITLAKYLEQGGIANLLFSNFNGTSRSIAGMGWGGGGGGGVMGGWFRK